MKLGVATIAMAGFFTGFYRVLLRVAAAAAAAAVFFFSRSVNRVKNVTRPLEEVAAVSELFS